MERLGRRYQHLRERAGKLQKFVTASGQDNPDVLGADPNTGFAVYDSYTNGTATPWAQFGGASDLARWAGLIGADENRINAGSTPLDRPRRTR